MLSRSCDYRYLKAQGKCFVRIIYVYNNNYDPRHHFTLCTYLCPYFAFPLLSATNFDFGMKRSLGGKKKTLLIQNNYFQVTYREMIANAEFPQCRASSITCHSW